MTQRTMRAVVVSGPGDYRVETVPMPDVPADGLLLKVLACGLCGSDLRTLRSGHHRVTFPFTIGHEICARVEATGSGYRGEWQKGDVVAIAPLVFCGSCDFCREGRRELCEQYREIGQHWQGGLAQYLPLTREVLDKGIILKVPRGMDPVVAAVAEPVSSCVHAQEKGRIGAKDVVVIIGSGPIGCIHAALARSAGVQQVIVADVNNQRLQMAHPFGVDVCIDTSVLSLEDEIRRITGGRGADVVITANPVAGTQVQAVEIARKGGRVLLFGGVPPRDERPGINTNLIHYNALEVIGTTIFNPGHFQKAMDLLAAGAVPIEHFITHRYPLEDFVTGARDALDGKTIKTVFEPWPRGNESQSQEEQA